MLKTKAYLKRNLNSNVQKSQSTSNFNLLKVLLQQNTRNIVICPNNVSFCCTTLYQVHYNPQKYNFVSARIHFTRQVKHHHYIHKQRQVDFYFSIQTSHKCHYCCITKTSIYLMLHLAAPEEDLLLLKLGIGNLLRSVCWSLIKTLTGAKHSKYSNLAPTSILLQN